MTAACIYLRPGEVVSFYETWPSAIPANVFAVALIETPPAPGDKHPEANPYALICMGHYECSESQRPHVPLWGWMQIPDKDDRDMIADTLIDSGANPGEWFYIKIEIEQED